MLLSCTVGLAHMGLNWLRRYDGRRQEDDAPKVNLPSLMCRKVFVEQILLHIHRANWDLSVGWINVFRLLLDDIVEAKTQGSEAMEDSRR
mmetsp:Transcript_15927/g.23121  ORF Transcript_15927/g.23121 Transcript_15927/m.23121 type:complete len:90 (-) Transcript_15927:336-605(-)